MVKKNILEIQWDSNWDGDQKVVYHVQMRVKKIKIYKESLLRWLLPLKHPGKTLLGELTRSDIDLKEKELFLLLPLSHKDTVSVGDLLDLEISDQGRCIGMKKHAAS
ncbi:MAG TPA: hypothetical protein VIJ46_00840 [Rhabdochlamydiaceae bacterium]